MAPLAIFVALVMTLIVLSGRSAARVSEAHASAEAMQVEMLELTELRSLSRSLQRDALNLAIEPDPAALVIIRGKFDKRHHEMLTRLSNIHLVVAAAGREKITAYVDTQARVLRELAAVSSLAAAGHKARALEVFRHDLRPVERSASAIADTLIDDEARQAKAQVASASDLERHERTLLLLATLVLSSLAIVLSWYLILVTVVRPLVRLCAAMERLAAGDVEGTTPDIARVDGIGQMARAVEIFRTATRDRQRLQIEAEAAREDRLRQEFDRQSHQAEARRIAALDSQRRALLDELAVSLEVNVRDVVGRLNASAGALSATANLLTTQARETSTDVDATSHSAQEAARGANAAAASTRELVQSIGEIDRQSNETSRSAAVAAERSRLAAVDMGQLQESAERVGTVITLIGKISKQINLLALNATIEAARAGEAGRGFAVVANEVKTLASETGRAAQEVERQISGMQQAANRAAGALNQTSTAIVEIEHQTCTTAAVVVQQGLASRDINDHVLSVAEQAANVGDKVVDLARAATGVKQLAGRLQNDAGTMAGDAVAIDRALRLFLDKLRAA